MVCKTETLRQFELTWRTVIKENFDNSSDVFHLQQKVLIEFKEPIQLGQ